MPPKKHRTDDAYLWDIWDSASFVLAYTSGSDLARYTSDRGLRRAVERELEIIGEAAGNISEAFRDQHPEIPWRPIIAQRHILSHEYGEIDDEKIWRVVTIHLPELVRLIEPLVPKPPETGLS